MTMLKHYFERRVERARWDVGTEVTRIYYPPMLQIVNYIYINCIKFK
jgi:hypothetical protein